MNSEFDEISPLGKKGKGMRKVRESHGGATNERLPATKAHTDWLPQSVRVEGTGSAFSSFQNSLPAGFKKGDLY